MNAMNRFANSAEAPDFNAPEILRRTRRRRTIGIAAVAAALIAAGAGTAVATSVGGSSNSSTTAATTTTTTNSDATTMLYLFPDGQTIPINFAGWSLDAAKAYMQKTQTKLGTVTKETVKGCKPGSVLGVSPHAPQTVKKGDTVSFTVCAG